MPLQGLDESRTDTHGHAEMDSDQFMHIYSLSRGHPLILELINRVMLLNLSRHTKAFVEGDFQ